MTEEELSASESRQSRPHPRDPARGEVIAGQEVQGEIVHRSVTLRQSSYPPPEDLAEYERIHPGFTDRILQLTEKETEHRISQERYRDEATVGLAKRGQVMALIIVLALVGGAVTALLTDHSLVGLAGIVVAAATLAGVFIGPDLAGRREASQNLEELSSDDVSTGSRDASSSARGD